MRAPGFHKSAYILSLVALTLVFILCVSVGSVLFAPADTLGAIVNGIAGRALVPGADARADAIICVIRAPRVLLAGLVGAALAIAGAAMQGLIKNPLADGSTLGVSSGATLGAVVSILLGVSVPGAPGLSTALFGIAFAFLSLLIILTFSRRMDANLSSGTIILTGIIFSMLTSSVVSLLIAFAGDHLKQIVFWTMGSLSGRGWGHAGLMAVFAVIGAAGILLRGRELDAFALGEEQAGYSGVNVGRVRLQLLVFVSVLCGAAVSLAGPIAFIGLTVPHMVRMLSGPLHTRLLPLCAIAGAAFLMLCDLIARVVIAPVELPIGIVTSLVGAAVFIYIFYKRRRM